MADFTRSRPSASSEPARNGKSAKPYRLILKAETEQLDPIMLKDVQVTSLSEHAKPLERGDGDTLHLAAESVVWLHEILGQPSIEAHTYILDNGPLFVRLNGPSSLELGYKLKEAEVSLFLDWEEITWLAHMLGELIEEWKKSGVFKLVESI